MNPNENGALALCIKQTSFRATLPVLKLNQMNPSFSNFRLDYAK